MTEKPKQLEPFSDKRWHDDPFAGAETIKSTTKLTPEQEQRMAEFRAAAKKIPVKPLKNRKQEL